MSALVPMSALPPTAMVVAAVAALAVAAVRIGMPAWVNRGPAKLPAGAVHARDVITRNAAADTLSVWPLGFPHEAPEEPFGVTAAHQAMQRHRDCSVEQCARKRAACKALWAAGKLIPDVRIARWL